MMISQRESTKGNAALESLIIASLMGDGEIFIFKDGRRGLYTTTNTKKSAYIQNYILHNSLQGVINLNEKTGEFYILPNHLIELYCHQWFTNKGEKIFDQRFYIPYKSIIIWVNLFGERQLESISVSTNVSNSYLRTLSISIEEYINLPVVPGRKSLKIYDIEHFFINTLRCSINDSASVANMLTKKELNNLVKVAQINNFTEGSFL